MVAADNGRVLTRWERLKRRATPATLRRLLWTAARFVLLMGLSFTILFPFIAKLSSAFMSSEDVFDSTVRYIPKLPTLRNIRIVLKYTDYFQALLNTAAISAMVAALQTSCAVLVGYGLAKYRFRGHGLLSVMLVVTIMMPPQTLVLALYMFFRYFDIFGLFQLLFGKALVLIDTPLPSVLLSITGLGFRGGLFIFIMRQFFIGVPDVLAEAANVDGASSFRTFRSVMLPLSGPVMVTVFMLSFAWQWTDTQYVPLLFSNFKMLSNVVLTVNTLAAEGILNGSYMSSVVVSTGVLLAVIPLLLVYIVMQRRIIEGIEHSGIVG